MAADFFHETAHCSFNHIIYDILNTVSYKILQILSKIFMCTVHVLEISLS